MADNQSGAGKPSRPAAKPSVQPSSKAAAARQLGAMATQYAVSKAKQQEEKLKTKKVGGLVGFLLKIRIILDIADPLIGLIPVVGDVIAFVFNWLMAWAVLLQFGAVGLFFIMTLVTVIDLAVGLIPGIGDAIDIFPSNIINGWLLNNYLEKRKAKQVEKAEKKTARAEKKAAKKEARAARGGAPAPALAGAGIGGQTMIWALVLIVLALAFIFFIIPLIFNWKLNLKTLLIIGGALVLIVVIFLAIKSKKPGGLKIDLEKPQTKIGIKILIFLLMATILFFVVQKFIGINTFTLIGIGILLIFLLLVMAASGKSKDSMEFVFLKGFFVIVVLALLAGGSLYGARYIPGKTFSEKWNYTATYLSTIEANPITWVESWFEKQIAYAAGDYYTGQVDKYADRPVGIFIKNIKTPRDFFYDDEDIIIWADLDAYLLEEKPMDVTINCTMDENISADEVQPDTELQLFSDKLTKIDCTFNKEKVKKGSHTITISADFNLRTMAYLTTYFMDEKKYQELTIELRDENKDIFDYYKVKDKEPVAKYNKGPIKYGLETEKPPILLYPGITAFLGVSLDRISGYGELLKMKEIRIHVPSEISVECTKPFKETGVSDNIGEGFHSYVYKPTNDTGEREAFYSYNCRMTIDPSILGDQPFVARAIKSDANYVYRVKKKVVVQVREFEKENKTEEEPPAEEPDEEPEPTEPPNYCKNIEKCQDYGPNKQLCEDDECGVGPCLYSYGNCVPKLKKEEDPCANITKCSNYASEEACEKDECDLECMWATTMCINMITHGAG